MSQSAQINQLSHKHEGLLQYLLSNPLVGNEEVARIFDMTACWVSTVKNSDCFRMRIAELHDVQHQEVVVPIRTKLMGVADVAVEKLGEEVEKSTDPAFILKAADTALHRLGFAPQRGPEPSAIPATQIENVYVVDPATLAKAREKIEQLRQAEVVVEQSSETLSAEPELLPAPPQQD